VIAPYVLHRHRALWDRPDVFDPGRFLGDASKSSRRFTYLPFGAGPRTCIGSAFALQEATLVLATVLHNSSPRAALRRSTNIASDTASSRRASDGRQSPPGIRLQLRGLCRPSEGGPQS
jgi:cytochrome P450